MDFSDPPAYFDTDSDLSLIHILIRPIAQLMGAKGILLDQCVLYGRIVILAVPGFILQMEFQSRCV